MTLKETVSFTTAPTWTLDSQLWKKFTSTWNQSYASSTSRNPLQSSQCLAQFLIVYWNTVFECAFVHLMILYRSRLQKNMKRRGGKREGAGRKKSPALAKKREKLIKNIGEQITIVYIWRVCAFSTWRKSPYRGNRRKRYELCVTAELNEVD